MDVAPVVVSPSQAWDGNDGPWSTFALGIGTPPQYVRVLVSTTCPQPWAVDPLGCTTAPNCANRRGNLFYKNSSSTWQDKGLYTLDEELNLGYGGNGNFGLDSITLGYPGSNAPNVSNQLLATFATEDFYLATWGIAPRPTNLTKPGQDSVTFAAEDAYPSLLTTMKQQAKIPSISYGYTAGARYRLKQVPASLTLGGYDASRFVPSNLTFGFADDNSRDLIVGIQSISVAGSPQDQKLLRTPILSFIDATVPHIWLPLEACEAFERAFGLMFDTDSDLYLINETQHRDLLTRNATLVLTIGADTTSSLTSDISLPYAAFDLQLAAYPNAPNATRYFPLRRAANDTQYTLGRTFLQETYLIADYERSQFSINQCHFEEGLSQNITAIASPNDTNITVGPGSSTNPHPKPSGPRLSSGCIAAIVVIPVVIFTVLCVIRNIFLRRKRRATKHSSRDDSAATTMVAASISVEHELHEDQLPLPELHDTSKDPWELDGGIAAVETSAGRPSMHEMG
ncbi:MAG: hypothetical protein LQ352_006956 [Teloschistes flavicans]|nr:MAG: hypothetical protein LQ352_006956 [Teloschistes flavicans]